MKKMVIALGILMAFVVNTQITFAACPYHKHTKKMHHSTMMKKHHYRHAHKTSMLGRSECPVRTGSACPCTDPCPCRKPMSMMPMSTGSACPCPCAAPCASPCATPCSLPCGAAPCAPSCNDCCD